MPCSIFTLLQQEGACFPGALFFEHCFQCYFWAREYPNPSCWNVLSMLFTWMTPSNLSGLNSNVASSCKPSLTFLSEDALPHFSLLTTLLTFFFFIVFNTICNQSKYLFFVYSQSHLEYKIHECKYLFMPFIVESWELVQYHHVVGAQ